MRRWKLSLITTVIFIFSGISLFFILHRPVSKNEFLHEKSNYDKPTIVYPKLLGISEGFKLRPKRSLYVNETSTTTEKLADNFYLYSINAFENEILLNLSRFTADNGLILAPNFLIQHYNSENFTWFEPNEGNLTSYKQCLFIGRILSENGKNTTTSLSSSGGTLLNLCDGMYGTLELPEGTYFLEPLLNETRKDKTEVAGDNSVGKIIDQPHLLYKYRSQAFHDYNYDRSRKSAERRSPNLPSTVSSQRHRNRTVDRRKRSYSWDHFIEVLVVADARMKQYHGSNLENYILTLLSIVATIYRHPSLEAALNIVVVRLIVLDHEQAGPIISENAQETLKQFCRWQQTLNDPDDDSVNHHDVAILLTRHDICRAPGKCDTLGLAELGTMCDPYRSCAIIEDNGLSAAFTIAHELGHIFNIPHDDEKKCSQHMSLDKYNFHIMAPTLEFNTHPWSWSPCSSATLHKFLESGRAHCLLDKPTQQKYIETTNGNPAPGLTFSVDQQCQFVFGSSATLCPYMPACKRLWCATVYQYQVGCRTQHMP